MKRKPLRVTGEGNTIKSALTGKTLASEILAAQMDNAGLKRALPPRLNKPTEVTLPIDDLQRAIDCSNAIARAAIKLFQPPYRRGAGVLCDEEERADWQSLREALTAAGYEIGEELT